MNTSVKYILISSTAFICVFGVLAIFWAGVVVTGHHADREANAVSQAKYQAKMDSIMADIETVPDKPNTNLLVVFFEWHEGEPFDFAKFKGLIEETLKKADEEVGGTPLYSPEMVTLLLGTCATESDFGQTSNNVFQITKGDAKDIIKHYFSVKDCLAKKAAMFWWDHKSLSEQLHDNLQWQIVMAAVHYERIGKKLPERNSIWAMAWTWKQYYNTHEGAGETKHFFKKFNLYCSL